MSASSSTSRSQTDWEFLSDPSEDGIDYSDIPPLEASYFEEASLSIPTGQEAVTLTVDRDLLAWYRAQGQGFQQRINSALRAYKDSRERA